jgi:hypothetical protein
VTTEGPDRSLAAARYTRLRLVHRATIPGWPPVADIRTRTFCPYAAPVADIRTGRAVRKGQVNPLADDRLTFDEIAQLPEPLQRCLLAAAAEEWLTEHPGADGARELGRE